jgi:tetratricopeptide (TPR) repeat protein
MYRNFVVPLSVTRTRYVKAWEFRPGSAAVHHATLHVDLTGSSRRLDDEDPSPGYEGLVAPSARTPDGFFLDWAPGHTPFVLPEGVAWPIREASDLVMMLHLRPSGKPERVHPRIGLYLTDTPPTRMPVMLRLTRQDVDVPAHAAAHTVTQEYRLPVDVDVYTVQPHAHYLAREVRGWATLPDGRVEPLIRIADWRFEWQDVFVYRTPLLLPAGATVSMMWRYDNSSLNPRNPHVPPRRVTYGQQTSDEMSELWLQVVPRTGADRDVLTESVRAHVLPEEIKGYEMMIQARPRDVALRNDVALLYAGAGNLLQSAAHFRAALELTPRSAAAHHNLGVALLAVGRREEAGVHFEQALSIDPDHGRAHRNLGVVRQSQGRLMEALQHYQAAVRLDAAEPEVYYNLGTVLQAMGRGLEAVPHYREALRARPDWPQALLGLAWALATLPDEGSRNPAEAISLAERAISIGEWKSPMAFDVLAAALAAAGERERAVAMAESAVALALHAGDEALASAIRDRLEYYRRLLQVR